MVGALDQRVRRVAEVVGQDLHQIHVRRSAILALSRLIPVFVASRARTMLLRQTGWRIGRGALFFGTPTVFGFGADDSDFSIGPGSAISIGCTLELADRVELGASVSLGPGVTILTSSHQLGPRLRRAGALYTSPVVIGEGVWIGANAVILPGVTIGPGAVVSANATVNKDVAANNLVAGSPATVAVKRLPG